MCLQPKGRVKFVEIEFAHQPLHCDDSSHLSKSTASLVKDIKTERALLIVMVSMCPPKDHMLKT
jgi:hypothetical protein